MEKKYNIYLATKVNFGKYKNKDKSVYQLIKEDVEYVDWLLEHPWRYSNVDDRVIIMFHEYWERRNMKKYGFRNDKKKDRE